MVTRVSQNLTIIRKTSGKSPDLPFVRIKNEILGRDYDLTLVFPTLTESVQLHKQWKQKNDPVNILSFPLDDTTGEMYITLGKIRTTARDFGLTYHEMLTYVFIHGCIHLLGNDHGEHMDMLEKKWCKYFKTKYPY